MTGKREPLRVGIIGCGRAAETRHLPAVQYLPEVRVIAAASRDPERLRRVAEHFLIRHRYADYMALLENPAVEAVAVCVPAAFHVPVALAALDAGKHVLVEKPLALDLDEGDRLVQRAGQSSRKVMMGFNLRWHPLVRRALELARQGVLGGSNRGGGVQAAIRNTGELLKRLPEAIAVRRQGGMYMASYRAEWRHFAQAIRNGLPVEATVADGWRALQVTLAALESASLGHPVRVAEASRQSNPSSACGTAGQFAGAAHGEPRP
jgi:predicted dehydrogenase